MASFAHVVVGLSAGRLHGAERWEPRSVLVMVALATFPDLDAPLARLLGAGPGSPWLHRGALHSLAAAAAAALLGAALVGGRRGRWRGLALAFAAAASHGLLDTITRGGAGVMLLWPFCPARLLAPWHPLPAAPMGWRLLSGRGLRLMAAEALAAAPLLVYACWARRPRRTAVGEGRAVTGPAAARGGPA